MSEFSGFSFRSDSGRRDAQRRYEARQFNRAIAGLRRDNHHSGLVSGAIALRVGEPPLPPVAEYDVWLASVVADWHPNVAKQKNAITGQRLRRIAIMRRGGSTLRECSAATGISYSSVAKWLATLPPHLGGAAA